MKTHTIASLLQSQLYCQISGQHLAEEEVNGWCNRLVEPAVRSNLVIALGDLAFRFPNLLEPWTERIYGPLSDPDTGLTPPPFPPPSLCYHFPFL